MKYFYYSLLAAIANCLAINSSATEAERRNAYLRFHAYEMMGSPIRITTKKKEDGLWQRDSNSEDSMCDYGQCNVTLPEHLKWIKEKAQLEECQKRRESQIIMNKSLSHTDVTPSSGHQIQLSNIVTSSTKTPMPVSENSDHEEYLVGADQVLANDLEEGLQQLRANLSICYNDGAIWLKCYHSFKSAISTLGTKIHGPNLPAKVKTKLRDEFRQILLKMLPMEEKARQICRHDNPQWDNCFYFSFEAYAQEIREVERMTRNILLEFIIYEGSSNRFFRTFKPKIDAQIARFNELTSFSVQEYIGNSEWFNVSKSRQNAAENINSLKAFLKSKRIDN